MINKVTTANALSFDAFIIETKPKVILDSTGHDFFKSILTSPKYANRAFARASHYLNSNLNPEKWEIQRTHSEIPVYNPRKIYETPWPYDIKYPNGWVDVVWFLQKRGLQRSLCHEIKTGQHLDLPDILKYRGMRTRLYDTIVAPLQSNNHQLWVWAWQSAIDEIKDSVILMDLKGIIRLIPLNILKSISMEVINTNIELLTLNMNDLCFGKN
jgi:hypothetical protein